MSESNQRQAAAQTDPKQLSMVIMSGLALGLGVFTGCGAAVFRWLIALVHNLAFLGHWSFHYDTSQFTGPSPWGAGIILVPILGGLIVTFLIVNYAPEARGHGVPEVMDAIFYKNSVIRPVVAAVKSVASAVAIGTGSAIGREGPIIQIGSAFGSTLGQILKIAPNQRAVLVAAGAGGGIAATFNTPIGGIMFALELMLPEISVSTFLPVALATEAATYVGRALLGSQPSFYVPPLPPLATNIHVVEELCLFALLGALVGLASGAFVKGLYFSEKIFDRIKNAYIRLIIGMLIMGLLIYGFFVFAGHYYVEGVGYAMIQALLTGQLAPGLGLWAFVGFLLLLFVAKLFATCVCLGAGSSGGIFSPSLFMGASLGAALATVLHVLHAIPGGQTASFAMVGMAAMVAGGTGAVMTAVIMIFEMTRDYSIVIPMVIAVAVAVAVRRVVSMESLYTIKLIGRGHLIPQALHANLFLVRHAADIMDRNIQLLPDSTALASIHHDGPGHIVATHNGQITAILPETLVLPSAHQSLLDVAKPDFIVVGEKDVIHEIIRRMWHEQAEMAIVTSGAIVQAPLGRDVVGVITKTQLANNMANTVLNFRNR